MGLRRKPGSVRADASDSSERMRVTHAAPSRHGPGREGDYVPHRGRRSRLRERIKLRKLEEAVTAPYGSRFEYHVIAFLISKMILKNMLELLLMILN